MPTVLRTVAGSDASRLPALPMDCARRGVLGSPIIHLTQLFIDVPAAGSGIRGLSISPSRVAKTGPVAYTMSFGLAVSPPARSRAAARAATRQRRGWLNNAATRRGDNGFGNVHSLHNGRGQVERPRAGATSKDSVMPNTGSVLRSTPSPSSTSLAVAATCCLLSTRFA